MGVLQVLSNILCFVCMNQVLTSGLNACSISLQTIKSVPGCPKDMESWEKAAHQKNCSSIRQSCVSPSKFRYHCVINAWRNITVELCAPVRIIFGHCAEFNIYNGASGVVIQDQYGAKCTNFSPPCPTMYNSDEAYKYQQCYTLNKGISNQRYSNGSPRILTVSSAILLSILWKSS